MSVKDPIRILLVEDDPDDVLLLKEALAEASAQPCRVTHAGRLKTGLELLAKGGVDVVLLDLNLPDSRGLDTLEILLSRTPRVPVVVMSGLADEALALEAVAQGAQDYLVKGKQDGPGIVRIAYYAVERHRLSQDMQISEIRARSIIEHNADGILIVDREGVVRFVNPAAEALFGRPAGQLIGVEFGFPVIAGQASEVEILRPGGSTRMVEMRATDLAWDGQPARMTALRDITERKEVEEALRESSAFNTMLLRAIPFGMDIVNESGEVLFLSPALEELLGQSALGNRCWDLYRDDRTQCEDCPLKKEFCVGGLGTIEATGVLGGKIFEISHIGMKFHGENAVLEVFHETTARKQAEDKLREKAAALAAEIVERERLQAELRALSVQDELTGLYNRRGFLTLAEQLWRLAKRNRQDVVMLYMDLDRFKHINDSFGHAQGDQALRDVARILNQAFRDSDVFGRIGGDEFAALLMNCDLASADIILARLKNKLDQANANAPVPYTLSMSFGVACFNAENPSGINELMEQADAAMFIQKQRLHKGRES
jgi:diguanylate cyclase (GGDEF)-like protein